MQKQPKIIICTEKGKIEKYALLLCRSIRKFGGELSDVEIYSFAPRKGFEPRKSTLIEFEKLNVEHQNIELNTKYRAYPLANKPLVCAYFEKQFPNENVVFIDSDQIIFNQPNDFILSDADEVVLRPVDRKGVGFSTKQDSEFLYWKSLMKLLNFSFENEKKVETSNGELIYPYFNSGLIITNTKFGLFSRWKENFDLVFEKNILPENGLFFLEQSLFSATVLQMKMKYSLMNKAYNYPFSLHDEITEDFRMSDLSQVVTAHYHDLFTEKSKPKFYTENFIRTPNGKWLKEQVKSLNITVDSHLDKFIAKVKRKMLK